MTCIVKDCIRPQWRGFRKCGVHVGITQEEEE
jgi:hypothetical protein